MSLRKSAVKQTGCASVVQVRLAPIASIWTPAGRVHVAYTGRDQDLEAIATLPIGECGLIERLRDRRHRQRKRLQAKGTSAARRRLRALAGRESRMMRDVNHQLSRHLVREASVLSAHGAGTGRGIAMERLNGIRDRVRAHRSQRRILHSWAFAQQITFTRYKAERAGIAFTTVDPAYTSQTCPRCGHVTRLDRPERGTFRCRSCSLAGHADHIAAINIATRAVEGWGAINRPHATGLPSPRRAPESKPPASARGR
ncbi:hypothetical protein GCM10023191_086930 [Actinoallomurus oryzae]|uniref:Cas12f1-like TNB domain-containing protein n=1 Tax=Actinoallomurus oryzae TaxID=502180 RepID=A0ABP8R232_9ACTN